MSNLNNELLKSFTILIPEGLVPSTILHIVSELADKYSLQVYLSTTQNIRILNVKNEDEKAIKDVLLQAGAEFKEPGKFPLPKVCVGRNYCKLGVVDTFALSQKINEKFGGRTNVKPKFKIAVSGCAVSCANSLSTDIGIRVTRAGYELFVGGKGGIAPQKGRRVMKEAEEDQILGAIEKIVDFHDQNTSKKCRIAKLIDLPGFPYSEV